MRSFAVWPTGFHAFMKNRAKSHKKRYEMLKRRWIIAPKISTEAAAAMDDVHPVLRQVLFNRGYTDKDAARSFLKAETDTSNDPFLLLDMEKAVERIQHAIRTGEALAVYGDYDADGVTSTALMMQTLRALGAVAQAYIPDRFKEGYGLNDDALQKLADDGVGLVITVDCGIRAFEQADFANSIGLDLIITDHHGALDEIPAAFAVINPKRVGDPYPDKNLAGVGTAYKLACALIERTPDAPIKAHELHDLVAMGTVADLVPLLGENRALVRAGLARLRAPHRQGVMALMGIAGIKPGKVAASDIGFGLGPRLNAAGRLDSALKAYQLLVSDDVVESGQIAHFLDNKNGERREITQTVQERAEALALEGDELPFVLFAADESFNPGVVGLAASRLVENHYRPAIIAHRGEEVTRASCRSIDEFHITEALDACADILMHHGGHAAAAGFTVANEHVDELIGRLEGLAAEKLADQDLRPKLLIDAEVKLADLSYDLLKLLGWLQPTGMGNREPLFAARGVMPQRARVVGRDGAHLKLTLSDGVNFLDAIAFRHGHWKNQLPDKIDVAFQFEMNEFNGRRSLQMNVRDIQAA